MTDPLQHLMSATRRYLEAKGKADSDFHKLVMGKGARAGNVDLLEAAASTAIDAEHETLWLLSEALVAAEAVCANPMTLRAVAA